MAHYYLTTSKVPTRDAPIGRPWARAWCPPGWDSQVSSRDASWLLLSRETDAAIVRLESPYTHPDLHLLATDRAERLAVATRSRLDALAGDRVHDPAWSFRETLGRLLRTPPADGRLGLPLRPNRRRGVYEVRIGPEVLWSEPGPFREKSTVVLTDNFNRTGDLDASTASGGGTWDVLESGSGVVGAWDTDGTVLQGSGISNDGFYSAWITTNHDTDDHSVQIDGVWGATNNAVGVGVRIQGASGTQGYGFEVGPGAAWRLYRWDTDANIANSASGASSPDTLYLEIDGSAYNAKLNGASVASGTNTLFVGHLRTCVTHFSSNEAASGTIDNFSATDIAAASKAFPFDPRPMAHLLIR